MEHDSHDDHASDAGGHGHRAVWHGLVTLGGIYLFFLVERVLGAFSARKDLQKERRLQVTLLDGSGLWEIIVS